ncbi:MAG TPA: hypothetical protein VII73_00210 [Caulobacteraceae bacterium]
MRLPDRLPSLEGRRAAVAQGIYVLLAALVAAIVLTTAWYDAIIGFRDLPAAAHYDFRLGADDGHAIVMDAGPRAKTAGVVSGDRIVALGGVEFAPGTTEIDVGARLARSRGPLIVDTEDAAGRVTRHRLARTDTLDQTRDPHSGLPLLVAEVNVAAQRPAAASILVAISVLLARKRRRDPEAMLLAFGFLLLAYGNASDYWLWQLHLPLSAGAVSWTENLLYVLGYWAMFVGMCAFPDGRFATRWARWAWMVPTAYVVANAATNFVLGTKDSLQVLGSALDVTIFIFVVGSILLRFRNAPRGVQRQQIKWALFGGAVMILGGVIGLATENGLVAAVIGPTAEYLFGQFSGLVIPLAFPLGLLVSLLRYRLYDVDTVITRSTVYAVLAVALVAVFASTERVIELLGEEYLGHSLGALADGVGAAVSAVMIVPLHQRIARWIEHRFRHDLLHLRQSLPPLVANLRETASPAELADAALHRVTHALHAGSGAVSDDDGNVLVAHNLSDEDIRQWKIRWSARRRLNEPVDPSDPLLPVHIPLVTEGAKPSGWLLLGPRPDGSLYGKDEREALADVAEPIWRCLTAAMRREKSLAAEERERAAFISRLEALERTVADLFERPAPA